MSKAPKKFKEQERILRSITFENGEINKIEFHKAKKYHHFLVLKLRGSVAFWSIDITLHSQEGSSIGVSLGLPAHDWNGKLLGLGNGGAAGTTSFDSLYRGLCMGYATVHTDMGAPKEPYDGIGNMVIIEDFGHLATHLMTVAAKEITEKFYSQKPKYCYFMGGSTGGQQCMSEAQRYPEDYNGIVCFCPAHDRVKLHTQFLWNLYQVNNGEEFTKKQLKAINARLIKEYAEKCGAAPGDKFLPYPDQIGEIDFSIFQDEYMKEKLTDDQIVRLEKIYAGPHDPESGESIFPGMTPGAECEALGLSEMRNKENFIKALLFPFYWKYGKGDKIDNFDFHTDYIQATKDLSPIMDAASVDLSAFRKNGGKLILIHGTADAAIAYMNSLEYYKKVIEMDGGAEKTKQYFRYFLVPGLAHGFGGTGFQDVGNISYAAMPQDELHDPIVALDKWVTQGEAPEMLIATAFKNGDILVPKVEKQRPVYCFPSRTKYVSGDPKKPQSYTKTE